MKRVLFKNTTFLKSVMKEEEYPNLKLPEIAIVGRSNVGKSTLLNTLFDSKSLVKTSKTPGKTQAINFFNVDQKLLFADLPGYGYAKLSMATKKIWSQLLDHYIKTREEIKLILFLLDIRHLPSKEDEEMYRYLVHSNSPFMIVFTKVDKLSAHNVEVQKKKIKEALGAQGVLSIDNASKDKLAQIILKEIA